MFFAKNMCGIIKCMKNQIVKQKKLFIFLVALIVSPLFVFATAADDMTKNRDAAVDSLNDFKQQIEAMRGILPNSEIDALLRQLSNVNTHAGTKLCQDTSGALKTVVVQADFPRNLKYGMTGDDVTLLQQILNSDPVTRVAETGDGSIGHETRYFGNMTKVAVIKFQEKYADQALKPANLIKGTGIVGPLTRAVLNKFQTTKQVRATGAAPVITSLTPAFGIKGTQVKVTGTNFAATGNNVCFGKYIFGENLSSSDGKTILFAVGNTDADLGNIAVYVYNDNGKSNGVSFSLTSIPGQPRITQMVPDHGSLSTTTRSSLGAFGLLVPNETLLNIASYFGISLTATYHPQAGQEQSIINAMVSRLRLATTPIRARSLAAEFGISTTTSARLVVLEEKLWSLVKKPASLTVKIIGENFASDATNIISPKFVDNIATSSPDGKTLWFTISAYPDDYALYFSGNPEASYYPYYVPVRTKYGLTTEMRYFKIDPPSETWYGEDYSDGYRECDLYQNCE